MPLSFARWGLLGPIQVVRLCLCPALVTSTSRLYPRLLHAVLINRASSNPVRAAYIASLESQISSLRDELATVYKTQGQNAQRLLAMNETLREKEEMSRLDAESLRKSRDEIAVLRKKVEQHNELMAEKDRTAQVSKHL